MNCSSRAVEEKLREDTGAFINGKCSPRLVAQGSLWDISGQKELMLMGNQSEGSETAAEGGGWLGTTPVGRRRFGSRSVAR